MYKDYPPEKLDAMGIRRVIDEMVQAAKNAMDAGFDGIEIHGANGYCESPQCLFFFGQFLWLNMCFLVACPSTRAISVLKYQHTR